MKRLAAATLALSALITLAACGDDGDDGDDKTSDGGDVSTTQAGDPTSTAAGTPTKEQAGQAFLDLAEPVNDAIARLNQLSGSGSVEQFNEACALVADAQSTFIDGADDATWPADVDPLVTELTQATESMRAHFLECAEAGDHAAVKASLDEAVRKAPTAQASAVRAALGLPAT